ncbi:WXG100 family type VII secretion target [Mycobacterium sp.]|uniref:WXG100 family type VII secretion target n=1 Tax=Mycobacterium sp. TaxID=1785 RepID=UPI0031D2D18E
MDRYRVELEDLRAFVQRLQEFEQRGEQIADGVDNLVTQLGGNWSGAAADAHQAEHDEWTAAATEMREAAAQLRQAADRAQRTYSEVIEINTAMWP